MIKFMHKQEYDPRRINISYCVSPSDMKAITSSTGLTASPCILTTDCNE